MFCSIISFVNKFKQNLEPWMTELWVQFMAKFTHLHGFAQVIESSCICARMYNVLFNVIFWKEHFAWKIFHGGVMESVSFFRIVWFSKPPTFFLVSPHVFFLFWFACWEINYCKFSDVFARTILHNRTTVVGWHVSVGS